MSTLEDAVQHHTWTSIKWDHIDEESLQARVAKDLRQETRTTNAQNEKRVTAQKTSVGTARERSASGRRANRKEEERAGGHSPAAEPNLGATLAQYPAEPAAEVAEEVDTCRSGAEASAVDAWLAEGDKDDPKP